MTICTHPFIPGKHTGINILNKVLQRTFKLIILLQIDDIFFFSYSMVQMAYIGFHYHHENSFFMSTAICRPYLIVLLLFCKFL